MSKEQLKALLLHNHIVDVKLGFNTVEIKLTTGEWVDFTAETVNYDESSLAIEVYKLERKALGGLSLNE